MVPSIYGKLTDIHSSEKNKLGSLYSPDGKNVYIYLKGVASVAAGSWVTFDENHASALLVGNAIGPVAIAMAAVVANKYGWFQVFGINSVASTDTVAADKQLYIDGTSGRADDLAVTGDMIVGAFSQAADSSNVCTVRLNYPFVTDALG